MSGAWSVVWRKESRGSVWGQRKIVSVEKKRGCTPSEAREPKKADFLFSRKGNEERLCALVPIWRGC